MVFSPKDVFMTHNNGPLSSEDLFAEFTPNEKINFAKIFAAQRAGDTKKVVSLKKKLTPSEEDKYALYERASYQVMQSSLTEGSKTIVPHHNLKKTQKTSSEQDVTEDPKKQNKGGCNIM